MHVITKKLTIFLATGGWIGFSPVAPGTLGSLAAIPLCWFFFLAGVKTSGVLILILIFLSVLIADTAEKIEGQKDPKQIVVDEICGMAITLFALPFTPVLVGCGFALFRVFDIMKPFPIRWAETKFPGGWGIVLDDLLAGAIAHLVLRSGMKLLSIL